MCGMRQRSVSARDSTVWHGAAQCGWGSTVWHGVAQCGMWQHSAAAWGSTVWHGAADGARAPWHTEAKRRAPEQGMYLCMAWVGACTRVTQVADKEHQSRACACLGMGCGMYTGHTEARRGATEQDMYTKLCTLHCTLHLQCRVDFLRMPDAPIAPAN
jgi:hypothetical protein